MINYLQLVCWIVILVCGAAQIANVWRQHGPLTGTLKQRAKCCFGVHDWQLLAFTTNPWRLIWRCHWCQAETLTPDTHRARVEADALMPPYTEQPATGATTKL